MPENESCEFCKVGNRVIATGIEAGPSPITVVKLVDAIVDAKPDTQFGGMSSLDWRFAIAKVSHAVGVAIREHGVVVGSRAADIGRDALRAEIRSIFALYSDSERLLIEKIKVLVGA